MSVSVQCPACHGEFRAKSELAGRMVRCPTCTTPFKIAPLPAAADLTALAKGDTLLMDAASPQPSPQAPPAPAESRAAAQPTRTPGWPRAWTALDRLLFRTGVGCLAFGVAAVILPAFGLQFRRLNQLDTAAPTAGWGLLGVGAFLCTYVSVLKGRLLRTLLILGVAAVLLVVGLIAAASVIGGRDRARQPSPSPIAAPMPPAGAPHASPHPQPRFTPPSPGVPPTIPGQPREGLPSAGGSPNPTTYESLVAKYGATRVVRVRFTGASGLDLAATIRARLATLLPSDTRPNWRLSTRGDEANLVLAPVGDFAEFVKGLDLGAVSESNANERSATVSLDQSRVGNAP